METRNRVRYRRQAYRKKTKTSGRTAERRQSCRQDLGRERRLGWTGSRNGSREGDLDVYTRDRRREWIGGWKRERLETGEEGPRRIVRVVKWNCSNTG